MNESASAGGGSNINGVLYQLLWTLLRVSKLGILQFEADSLNSVSSAVVVAEPSNGGDIQVMGNHNEVEQLKARSTGAPWSLKEIIVKVLPDFFLAVSNDSCQTQTFRLISEGGIGGWLPIYTDFFRDLGNRTWNSDLTELDASKPLSTGAKKPSKEKQPFFPTPCTEKVLFSTICNTIRKRPSVTSLKLDQSELSRRVWRLLAHFDFPDPIKQGEVQARVDSLLLAIVAKESDIPKIRDHLSIELAKLATKGNAIVESVEFLRNQGLNAVPLTNWVALRKRAEHVLQRTLSRRNYNPKYNVRSLEIPKTTGEGILIVAGDTGCGKSWTINSLALQAAGSRLSLLIDARGDAEKTMEKAADVFCHEIHDSDETLPFSRIGKRIRKIFEAETEARISIFIDGILCLNEANDLLNYDWEDGGSSLTLSCSTDIARDLERIHHGRVTVLNVGHFSIPQLNEYLYRRIGDAWATIPTDIRSTLLNPLIASSYCDLFGKDDFKLESEYQLFQTVYTLRVTGQHTNTPLDEVLVEQLAVDVREGGHYPWTKHQLRNAGFTNEQVVRLVSRGWLSQTDDGSYRIFHDRLLNWSIASALERQLANGTVSDEVILNFVKDVYNGKAANFVQFGHAPLDFLWLITNRQPNRLDLNLKILTAMESMFRSRYKDMYRAISTLGNCISDTLFRRYQEVDIFDWLEEPIRDSLIATSGEKLADYVRSLLEDQIPMNQRKACRLSRNHSFPLLVRQFWRVHNEGQNDPSRYGDTEGRPSILYQETFRTLNRAATANSNWLDEQLSSGSEKTLQQLESLATFVCNLDDNGKLWKKHKRLLITTLRDDHKRCLIRAISRFRDAEELDLVEQWILPSEQITSALAIQTLGRLDSNRAIAQLRNTSPLLMRMTKKWCLHEIIEYDRDHANLQILAWMLASKDPWEIGLLFEGRENDLTPEHLRCLLNSLAGSLAVHKHEPDDSSFAHEFQLLGRISKLELIECIRQFTGTNLETQIRNYLLEMGPHRGMWGSFSGRKGALMMLHIMESKSFTYVINQFLTSGDQYGIIETLEWAVKAPDSLTFDRLQEIVNSKEGWPGISTADEGSKAPIVQNEALRCLASHEKWESVANGVRHLGASVFYGLEHPKEPIEAKWLDLLREDVGRAPNIGNVSALGIFIGSKNGLTILRVLQEFGNDVELALSCIVALDHCCYFNEDAVEEVAKHIRNEKLQFAAISYLNKACIEASWKVLVEYIEDNFDPIVALNLINLSGYAERVIEICHKHFDSLGFSQEHHLLEVLLTSIRDTEHRNHLLENESVQATMHFEAAKSEQNFWFTGSKERMIRCLALSHRELAYSACLKCIDNNASMDRSRYPYLLREIDSEKAVHDLTERLITETSSLMKCAILHTLSGLDTLKKIEQFRRDHCKNKRRAACELLSIWRQFDQARSYLKELLSDNADEVVTAALEGLQAIRDFEIQSSLLDAIHAEPDRRRRNTLVDALVNTCELGEEWDVALPEIQAALNLLSQFERDKSIQRLKKRLKERNDNLKRADRQGK